MHTNVLIESDIKTKGALPSIYMINTGGMMRCPGRCRFCFLNGTPLQVFNYDDYSTFLTLKDVKRMMDGFRDFNDIYFYGMNVDAFANPEIYDILEYVSFKLPSVKKRVLTSGVLIKKDKLERMKNYPNFSLELSMYTVDAEKRKDLFTFPNTDVINNVLDCCKVNAVVASTGDSERTLNDIRRLEDSGSTWWFKRIEYTKYSNDHAKKLAYESIDSYEPTLQYLFDRGVEVDPFAHFVDLEHAEKYPFKLEKYKRDIMSEVNSIKKDVEALDGPALMLTNKASHSYYTRMFRDMVDLFMLENNFFGGSIFANGLMTYKDVAEQLLPLDLSKYKYIILSKRTNAIYSHFTQFQKSSQDVAGTPSSVLQRQFKQKILFMGTPVRLY